MWIWRNRVARLGIYNYFNNVRYLSNKTAWVCKIKRSKYTRLYPTLLVLHDGSTLTFRYHEPRKIIKLPIDISTLSEEEKIILLENRKPKKKVVEEKEVEDSFDSVKYLRLLQKKKVIS